MVRLLILLLLCPSLLFAAEGNIQDCQVLRPQGEYALLTLQITIPDDPEARQREAREDRLWTWYGGGRDGRFRVEDGVGLREPGGYLTLRDGRLSGSIKRISGSRRGGGFRFTSERQLENLLQIEATVQQGKVQGTCQIGSTLCRVSGEVIGEQELARTNPIPADQAWPWLQGPHCGGLAAAASELPLIDDLQQIRRLWRTEETDIGAGMGSISRAMQKWEDATTLRTGSGSASPLVAEGKLYFSYQVPAAREANQPELKNGNAGYLPESEALKRMLAQARQSGFSGEQLPPYAAEKCFQNVNDVLLCADAATGKTLWKAVIRKRPQEATSPSPARGGHSNLQHHKLGPFNRSPAYAEGRVFALGMTNRLYAFDAETGTPLWERPIAAGLAEALLAVDGLVIAPDAGEWAAFDAATGEPRWRAGRVTAATLVPWNSNEKTYLIGRTIAPGNRQQQAGQVSCFDAQTGETVWTLPVAVVSHGRGGGGAGGISVFRDILLLNRDDTPSSSEPDKETYHPVLAAYRLTPSEAVPLWTLGGQKRSTKYGSVLNPIHYNTAPVVVRGRYVFTPNLKTVDLQTGKVVGEVQGDTPVEDPNALHVPSRLCVPKNGGHMMSLGSVVLVRVDGTHGRIRCGWYSIGEDGSVRLLNPTDQEGQAIEWEPPGAGTTSYHNPLYYPMVAGRVFIRQEDGIYCYDFRAR